MDSSLERIRSSDFDIDTFRRVMSHFCTGVVIVAACDDDGPIGFTCQSFTSLSTDPPLILLCPSKSSTSWPRIRAAGTFCVNVLNEDQAELSTQFAKSGGPKFDGIEWTPGVSGAPRLTGAVAHIDCQLHELHDGGDHEIVVGRVLALDHMEEHHPLLYFRSRYAMVHR
jgi:3-hydroxy-9,10-secoandrosta-1,3,5(10)-triene-9,17-dione monooxygenase reductase component